MWSGLRNLFSDKVFNLAIGMSVILHMLLLGNIPKIRVRPGEPPRFVYRGQERTHASSPPRYVPPKKERPSMNLGLKGDRLKQERFGERLLPHPQTRRVVSTLVAEKMKNIDLRSPEDIDDALFKKMIEVQEVPADPKVKGYYLAYYDRIRRRIRDTALKLYRQDMPGGDVFISFMLDSSGRLIEAHVVPEKSSASRWLFKIAMEALRKSSPFGKFPPELIQDRLRFNVIISFYKR